MDTNDIRPAAEEQIEFSTLDKGEYRLIKYNILNCYSFKSYN